MIHLYECLDDDIRYWEIYKSHPFEAWLCVCPEDVYHEDLEDVLDNYRAEGLDFVLHTLEDYDEYHVALPSV